MRVVGPLFALIVLTAFVSAPALGSERPGLEKAESVQACPRHGPGFFKIPGTDTCMRLGGRVRSEYGMSGRRVSRDDIAGFGAGARVSADVRTDTAYGPLRSYVRVKVHQGTTSRD